MTSREKALIDARKGLDPKRVNSTNSVIVASNWSFSMKKELCGTAVLVVARKLSGS